MKSQLKLNFSTAARNTGTERVMLTPGVFKGYSPTPTPHF